MTDLLHNGLLNLNYPGILFFILGFLAAIIKSDIKIPDAIVKILSIYLMMAIGFKGGVEISKTGIESGLIASIANSILIGILTPTLVFFMLKRILKGDVINAGAIAAHYGSVSVVTFITAITFLERSRINFDGYLVGMMAMMEAPAIFVSLLLVSIYNKNSKKEMNLLEVTKEALFNGSVVLLFGSLLIGFLTKDHGNELTKSFFVDPFQGILTLFLLEMGLLAGRRIGEFKLVGLKLGFFALLVPLVNGALGGALAILLGLQIGNATLFAVLAASASYIAAPAAVRLALPDANPSYYITMSLAITFPFNIIFGIPIYHSFCEFLFNFLR